MESYLIFKLRQILKITTYRNNFIIICFKAFYKAMTNLQPVHWR